MKSMDAAMSAIDEPVPRLGRVGSGLYNLLDSKIKIGLRCTVCLMLF